MKVCSRCEQPKELDQFAFRNKEKNIRQSYCKRCRKTIDSTIWANNPNLRARKVSRQNDYRARNRAFVLEYLLQHPCVDCPESDPVVLEFDHRGGKTKGIASMMESASLETLKAEIAKCDVRCANCHRRKTAKDFGYYRYEQQRSCS